MRGKPWKLALAGFAAIALTVCLLPEKADAADVTSLSINGQDILTVPDHVIQCGKGTAAYDPETNTLTLENAEINTLSGTAGNQTDAVAFDGDLQIVLEGKNKITGDYRGIVGSNGDLEIRGGGSLTVSCKVLGIWQGTGRNITVDGAELALYVEREGNFNGTGMQAEGILTIRDGAKVTATADDIALIGNDGISITSGSMVRVEFPKGTEEYALLSDQTISVSGATLEVESTSTLGYPVVYAGNDLEDSPGKISISDNSDVTVHNPGGTGLYAFYQGDIQITDSTFTGTALYPVLQADRDILMKDSKVDVTSGENYGIYAYGSIQFAGASDITARGKSAFGGGSSRVIPAGSLIDVWTGSSEASAEKTDASPISEDMDVSGRKRYFHSEPHVHLFDQEIAGDAYKAGDATCTEPAMYYKSCVCGAAGTETFAYGDALGHDVEVKNAKEATSAQEGYTGDKVCKVCGELIGKGQIIPKTDPGEEEKTDDAGVPKTGDAYSPVLWSLLLFLSCAGVFDAAVMRRKDKRNR